jgi:hypothetical protein
LTNAVPRMSRKISVMTASARTFVFVRYQSLQADFGPDLSAGLPDKRGGVGRRPANPDLSRSREKPLGADASEADALVRRGVSSLARGWRQRAAAPPQARHCGPLPC